MTQLVIAGIELPETSRDQYSCYPAEKGKQLEMISGRTVFEIRGQVTMVEYAIDYIEDAMLRALLKVLRSRRPFLVRYLPDDDDTPSEATFFCKSLTPPKYLGSEGEVPIWHKLSFTLQSEYPIDEED